MLERAKKSGRKFLNPVETEMAGVSLMLKLIPMYVTNREETEPKTVLGPFRTDASVFGVAPESGLRVTWFGHSSMLVEVDGVRVLLDPVWDERASPFSFMGPKRFYPPTMELEELPSIDAVVLSHDHYDHLGKETVRKLAKARPELRWVCPLGVGAVLERFEVDPARVTELDWTESTVISGRDGAELTVTALPARHFSGRSFSNRFETLWACYALKSSKHSVYYGADTGLWDGFEKMAAEYGPFDLTMLEVGAFHPLWASIHMGPDGAAQAFAELGGGVFMPIHWGLFNLALHGWRQPIERVYELAAELDLKLFAPEPGVPTEVAGGKEVRSGWWRKTAG